MAVKQLSTLLQEIISKNNGNYYCINCRCSIKTQNKIKKHKGFCKNNDYCYIKMPEKGKKL